MLHLQLAGQIAVTKARQKQQIQAIRQLLEIHQPPAKMTILHLQILHSMKCQVQV